jgi:Family of unknown function (DUF6353)
MSLKTKATVKIGRTILKVKKNSPGLMFGIGMVTMVGTVIVASRATLKLDETLKEHELVDNTRENKIELAVNIGKLYAPAIILGGISVGCLTGSHIVLNKRNAALTAAYAALDKTYRDYRDRVREQFGDEKERELSFGVDKNTIVRDDTTNKVLEHGPGKPSVYARFFDQTCPNWSPEWQYNRIFLDCAQNYCNDMLRGRGHIFLNEVYDMLGIDRTKAGSVVGWVLHGDGDNFVDFGIFDKNNERKRAFVNGIEGAVLLDFNVDGVIYDKI